MQFILGLAIGGIVAFILCFLYYGRIVAAAHLVTATAQSQIERAKVEYYKLKAGVAHKLDEILK